LSSTPVAVPVYLPITVQVAVGRHNGDDGVLNAWIQALALQIAGLSDDMEGLIYDGQMIIYLSYVKAFSTSSPSYKLGAG
jgi:hypothetical protein